MFSNNWYTKSAGQESRLSHFWGNLFRTKISDPAKVIDLIKRYHEQKGTKTIRMEDVISVLEDKGLHPDVMRWVLDPKNKVYPEYREMVMRHKNLPVDCIHMAIKDVDNKIANMAAEHPNADDKLFMMIASEIVNPTKVDMTGRMYNRARILYALLNPSCPYWFRYFVFSIPQLYGEFTGSQIWPRLSGHLEDYRKAKAKNDDDAKNFIKEIQDMGEAKGTEWFKEPAKEMVKALIRERVRSVALWSRSSSNPYLNPEWDSDGP